MTHMTSEFIHATPVGAGAAMTTGYAPEPPLGGDGAPTECDELMAEFKRLFAEQAVKIMQAVPDQAQAKSLCACIPLRQHIRKTLARLDEEISRNCDLAAQVNALRSNRTFCA